MNKPRPLFTLMVHAGPRQVHRLWKLLFRPDCFYIVHCDAKAGLPLKLLVRALVLARANAVLLQSRPIYLGGWSQVQVQLDAMRRGFELNWPWTHFVGISGQCLPIKNLEQFLEFLRSAGNASFIDSKDPCDLNSGLIWRDPRTGANDPKYRVEYKYDEYTTVLGGRVLNRGPQRLNENRHPWPLDVALRGGASWVVIHRSHGHYLTGSPLCMRIQDLFRQATNSDEMFFQTALHNSPYASEVKDQLLWEIDWTRGAPYTWRDEDFDHLQRSSAFFARKFDLCQKDLFMRRLEHELVSAPPVTYSS